MNSAIMKCAVALLAIMAVCQSSSAATTTYKYDALGRVSVVTDGGSVIRYFYDAAATRPGRGSTKVQFGGNANQVYHAFRHVDQLGLDRAAVQGAIRQDLVGRSLTVGEFYSGRWKEVGSVRLQYNAYRLSEEIINVARITGP